MYPILFPTFPSARASVGLLVLRLVAGCAMALHGWAKLQNPMGWMGPEAPVPGFLQAAAVVAEFGGGICWVLGLLTPLASVLLTGNMAVAAWMGHISQGHPFVSTGGPSSELALLYLAIAVTLLLVGPGRLSADWCLFGRAPGEKQ